MIAFRRLVRKAFAGWRAWRSRKLLVRAIPELVEIDRELEALREAHRPTRRHLRAKRNLILTVMAQEQGKKLPEGLLS